MSFEAIFMFVGFVILGLSGVKRYKNYENRLNNYETVSAIVIGTGENRQAGRYYLLSFQTEGGRHELPYPAPKKGNLFTIGQTVTLYYDINHLDQLLIKEDKSETQAIQFYFSVAAMLLVFTLLLW